jgi:mycothiol system anti-sigma-R factor
MSSGDSHKHDCQEVLRRVYVFIDEELQEADHSQIQQHLDECGPCLREVDLERMVKMLVARSCHERAPVELRQRVMFSIRQVQLPTQRPRLEEAGSSTSSGLISGVGALTVVGALLAASAALAAGLAHGDPPVDG